MEDRNLTQTNSESRNFTSDFRNNFRYEQLPTDLLRVAARLSFLGSWRYFVGFTLLHVQPKVTIHHTAMSGPYIMSDSGFIVA